MNTASSLFKELATDEIQNVMDYSLGEKSTIEYKLLAGGMYNTTYMINDKTNNRKYVLRIGPTNEHLIMPFEYNMMNAEKYAYCLCKEYDIPVSNVVVCDTSRRIIDREFMLVDFIESTAMCNIKLDDEVKARLYQDVGRYIQKMHMITNTKFGRLSRVLLDESFTSWGDYLIHEMKQWALKADKYNSLLMPTDELFAVVDKFKKHKEILDKIHVPYLVHTDIWEGNILITEKNGKYEVVAIIDADRALFGDPDFDLASGWMINDSFIKGYGQELNMSDDAVIRRKLYKFCLDCFDAYALKVEYNNEKDGNERIEIVRQYLKEL